MKNKRILICCNRTLGIGGIEKALTTFIKSFDTINNDVTLVLSDSKGELYQQLLTKDIHIFFTSSIDSAALLQDDVRHLRITEIAKGIYNRVMLRLNKNWYAQIMYSYRVIQRKLRFSESFDCAISFTTDFSDLSMVVAAKTGHRIAFVHADATQNPYIASLNDKLLQQIDKIYCVSESSKELFLKAHPRCVKTVDVFYNIVDAEEVLRQGELPAEGMILDETPTLCTVGRLAPEKGQDLIPETALLLRKAGYKFRWYLVGDGSLRPQLEAAIIELGLEDCVILMGAKVNPYPYMKNCNVYVQTSLTEAYCITLKEARVFNKFVVTTDFTSVQEQIEDGQNGLIAKKTPASLAKKIGRVLNNLEQYRVDTASTEPKEREMEKIYRYIEGE